MAATGGSLESLNIHGRNFSVAGDAAASRMIGGGSNEVQINGNGSVRLVTTRTAWKITGIEVSVDNDNEDQEYIQGVIDSKVLGVMNLVHAGGTTYTGTGTVTGDFEVDTQKTTATIEISGSNKLVKQG